MKKNSILLIISLILIFLNTNTALAAKVFVVEKTASSKILITDGYSEYIIEYDYNCYDSDFNEGDSIYIDTSYSPSYGDKIITSGYSKNVCEVTNSDDVNMKEYYVDKVLDSEDKIIVTGKNGDQLLVEYGIGCGVSMWRYEGKKVYIDIGGSYLDGIGDRMYLFDSDRDCKIWDAEELKSSSIYSGSSGYTSKTDNTQISCPTNSYLKLDNKCYCNTGYVVDSLGACNTVDYVCKEKYGPLSYGTTDNSCSCPNGYQWNSANTACVLIPTCSDGYVYNNGSCVTYTQSCQSVNNNDPLIIGTKGNDGKINCNCISGYFWNGSKCLINNEVLNVKKNTPELKNDKIKITTPNSGIVDVSKNNIIATTSGSSTNIFTSNNTDKKIPWYSKLWKFIWRF